MKEPLINPALEKDIMGLILFLCLVADLVDNSGHELWVRLLIGQELSDDFVHDVLWREEVVQKLGQNPRHDPSLTGQTLPDPAGTGDK